MQKTVYKCFVYLVVARRVRTDASVAAEVLGQLAKGAWHFALEDLSQVFVQLSGRELLGLLRVADVRMRPLLLIVEVLQPPRNDVHELDAVEAQRVHEADRVQDQRVFHLGTPQSTLLGIMD